jgi:antitoxin (DNA-binding transcriptional repressor) of toxin-antitoxin stability system
MRSDRPVARLVTAASPEARASFNMARFEDMVSTRLLRGGS